MKCLDFCSMHPHEVTPCIDYWRWKKAWPVDSGEVLPLFASPFWLDDLTGMAWPKHFRHLIEKHIEAGFQDVKRLICNWADSKLQLLRQISRSYPWMASLISNRRSSVPRNTAVYERCANVIVDDDDDDDDDDEVGWWMIDDYWMQLP